MKRKVIIGSAHHWQSPIQISAHQLARQFVKQGWQVAFISNPISPIHLLRCNESLIASRFKNWCKGGDYDEEGRLFHYCPMTCMPLMSKTAQYSWVVNHWHQFAIPNPAEILKEHGFSDVDMLLLDSPLQGYLLNNIHAKKTIFRVTDFNPGFGSSTKILRVNEAQLIKKVDCVVITAEKLRNYVVELGARSVIHMPNGVDFVQFSKPQLMPPLEYFNIPKPRAIYVGSMGEWFDYSLLEQAVVALPKVSFVLIGPDRMAKKRLKSYPNLFVLGPRSHDTIPGYLQYADVGLIPFDVLNYANLVSSINPIKLYEYFACGLPVVATDWDELRNLSSPAHICKTTCSFIDKIRHIVFSNRKETEQVCSYAAENDWQNQFKKFLHSVDYV